MYLTCDWLTYVFLICVFHHWPIQNEEHNAEEQPDQKASHQFTRRRHRRTMDDRDDSPMQTVLQNNDDTEQEQHSRRSADSRENRRRRSKVSHTNLDKNRKNNNNSWKPSSKSSRTRKSNTTRTGKEKHQSNEQNDWKQWRHRDTKKDGSMGRSRLKVESIKQVKTTLGNLKKFHDQWRDHPRTQAKDYVKKAILPSTVMFNKWKRYVRYLYVQLEDTDQKIRESDFQLGFIEGLQQYYDDEMDKLGVNKANRIKHTCNLACRSPLAGWEPPSDPDASIFESKKRKKKRLRDLRQRKKRNDHQRTSIGRSASKSDRILPTSRSKTGKPRKQAKNSRAASRSTSTDVSNSEDEQSQNYKEVQQKVCDRSLNWPMNDLRPTNEWSLSQFVNHGPQLSRSSATMTISPALEV